MFGLNDDDTPRCPHCGVEDWPEVGWSRHTCDGTIIAAVEANRRRAAAEMEQMRQHQKRLGDVDFLIRHGVDPDVAFFIS